MKDAIVVDYIDSIYSITKLGNDLSHLLSNSESLTAESLVNSLYDIVDIPSQLIPAEQREGKNALIDSLERGLDIKLKTTLTYVFSRLENIKFKDLSEISAIIAAVPDDFKLPVSENKLLYRHDTEFNTLAELVNAMSEVAQQLIEDIKLPLEQSIRTVSRLDLDYLLAKPWGGKFSITNGVDLILDKKDETFTYKSETVEQPFKNVNELRLSDKSSITDLVDAIRSFQAVTELNTKELWEDLVIKVDANADNKVKNAFRSAYCSRVHILSIILTSFSMTVSKLSTIALSEAHTMSQMDIR